MSNFIRRCWKCFRLTDRWEIRQIQNPDRSYTAAVCTQCLSFLSLQPPTPENPMEPQPEPQPEPKTAIAEKVEGAIARLQAKGETFTLKDVKTEAGVSTSTLYSAKYSGLLSQVREAAIASGNQRSRRRRNVAVDIELPALDRHLQEFAPQLEAAQPEALTVLKEFLQTPQAIATNLQQRIDELEQRNRELREQLAQSQPQIIQIAPLAWLEREVEHWRSRTAALDEQICQMQEDLASAQRNLESYERMLRLNREAILFETDKPNEGAEVVTSNGNGVATNARA